MRGVRWCYPFSKPYKIAEGWSVDSSALGLLFPLILVPNECMDDIREMVEKRGEVMIMEWWS